MAASEKCGACGNSFPSAQYLSHVCEKTGFTPADIEHQGQIGILIAKASLRRGGGLNKTQETALDAKIEAVKNKNK